MKATAKTYLLLFLTFLKIGLFTFGGGYAMIALIEDEIVSVRKWLSKEELADVVTIAESTPGPIAINSSTFVGYKIGGALGSFLSTFAVVLPSFCIIFAISFLYDAFVSIEPVKWAFFGIKCAVGLLIIRAGIKMLKSFRKTPLSLTCFFAAFVGVIIIDLFAVRVSLIYFILVGAIIGVVSYFVTANRDKTRAKSTNTDDNSTNSNANSTNTDDNSTSFDANSTNSDEKNKGEEL